jgi:hypothetical protein
MNGWSHTMKRMICQFLFGAIALGAAVSAAQSDSPKPMLSHSVYFQLTDRSVKAREALVEACHRYLSGHPGIVWFAAGTRGEEFDREVNDQDYDVALYIVFENRAAHDQYQAAPRHDQFIQEQRHNWAKVRVFDSWVTPGRVPVDPLAPPRAQLQPHAAAGPD